MAQDFDPATMSYEDTMKLIEEERKKLQAKMAPHHEPITTNTNLCDNYNSPGMSQSNLPDLNMVNQGGARYGEQRITYNDFGRGIATRDDHDHAGDDDDDDGAAVVSTFGEQGASKPKQRRRKRGSKGHQKKEREERLEAERLAAEAQGEEAGGNHDQSMQSVLKAKDLEIRQLKAQLREKEREVRERDDDRRSHKERLRLSKTKEGRAGREADIREEPQTLRDSIHAPGFGENSYASAGGHHSAYARNTQASTGSSYGRSTQRSFLTPTGSSMLRDNPTQIGPTNLQTTTNRDRPAPQTQVRSSIISSTILANRGTNVQSQRQPNNTNPSAPSSVQQAFVGAQRQPNGPIPFTAPAAPPSTARDARSPASLGAPTGPRGMSRTGRGGSNFDAGRWIRDDQHKRAGW